MELEIFETSNLAKQEVGEMVTCNSERWGHYEAEVGSGRMERGIYVLARDMRVIIQNTGLWTTQ